MQLYYIQIKWFDIWITVPKGFATQGDAEWNIGLWKQENKCYGDSSFRVVKMDAFD